MAVIGIEINEVSRSSTGTLPDGFICCHMVINAPESTEPEKLNKPEFISSYESFLQLYSLGEIGGLLTDVADVVRYSVKLFFENNQAGRLWLYPGKIPVDISTDLPPIDDGENPDDDENGGGVNPIDTESRALSPIAQNLEHCLNEIAENADLELGFVVIPEAFDLDGQEDITGVFSAARNLVEKQEWIYLANHTKASVTKQDLITERQPLVSPLGHCAFYGSSVNVETDGVLGNLVQIPLTPIVAAIGLKRSVEETVFSPPGGSDYPIQGIKSVEPYFSLTSDYKELKGFDINIVQKIPPDRGFCVWGARTLAADDLTNNKFGDINSRMAVSITIKRLEVALTPYLFDSLDPQGFTRREIVRVIRQTMNEIYREEGLSGSDANDSYRVEEVVETESANLRRIRINIYARFVGTLEEIAITLIATDNVTVLT